MVAAGDRIILSDVNIREFVHEVGVGADAFVAIDRDGLPPAGDDKKQQQRRKKDAKIKMRSPNKKKPFPAHAGNITDRCALVSVEAMRHTPGMVLILTRRLQPLRGLVDLAPVVTVVLLLLFFFLLSSSFVLQTGIKVDPPRSISAAGTPSSRLIVAVALAPAQVDANGMALPREPVLYFNDQIVTLDGLSAALDKLPVSRVTPSLVIKADKEVPLSVVTSIWDIAFKHRLSVVTATQSINGTTTP